MKILALHTFEDENFRRGRNSHIFTHLFADSRIKLISIFYEKIEKRWNNL